MLEMDIFQRHKKTSLFLFLYYAWWAFMAWYIFNAIKIKGPHCDFSPVFFLPTIPISFLIACVFLAKHLDIKSNTNNDFMVFIGLLFLPYFPAVYFDPYHILKSAPTKNINHQMVKTISDSCPVDSTKNNISNTTILYKKANHKLGYWISKK